MNSSCLSPLTLWLFLFHHDVDFQCKVGLASVDSVSVTTLHDYLPIFLWTCGLEAPFYIGYLLHRRYHPAFAVMMVIGLNLATHPAITFLIPQLAQRMGLSLAVSLAFKEIFAPAMEGLLLKLFTRLTWVEALSLASLTNLFSWWLGAELPSSAF